MPGVMVSLRLEPAEATVPAVARRLGLEPADLDAEFGVVCLDERRKLYAILVEERIARGLEGKPGVVGVYANPPIEPIAPSGGGRGCGEE